MAYDYSSVRDNLQEVVMKKLSSENIDLGDLKMYVRNVLRTEKLKSKVQNVIYHSIRQETVEAKSLTLKKTVYEIIEGISQEWKVKLQMAVKRLVSKSGAPLLRPREKAERDSIEEHWSSLGNTASSSLMVKVDPVYSPDDLYNFVSGSIERLYESTNGSTASPLAISSLRLDMPTLSCIELRNMFQELHPSVLQSDIVVSGRCKMLDDSKVDADIRAARVIQTGLNPLARQVCKTGCPHSQRFRLWCMALSIDVSSLGEMEAFFLKLKDGVLDTSSLLDSILISDVSSCISDNDSYFVFEDMAYQLALAFVRDPDNNAILDWTEFQSHPILSAHPNNLSAHANNLSPHPNNLSPHANNLSPHPNNVSTHDGNMFTHRQFIPCHGFSCFIAPLCYLHNDVHVVYQIFKVLYNRYFRHLPAVSGHSYGILYLSAVFEALLEERIPQLVLHCHTHGIDTLRLVFKWMFYGFANCLKPDQLLLLWDRIIGFDSLLLLPMLAVAILEFRTSYLMLATTFEQAENMLSDLHHIAILPLLQTTLFL